jgi:hypothetical protein
LLPSSSKDPTTQKSTKQKKAPDQAEKKETNSQRQEIRHRIRSGEKKNKKKKKNSQRQELRHRIRTGGKKEQEEKRDG